MKKNRVILVLCICLWGCAGEGKSYTKYYDSGGQPVSEECVDTSKQEYKAVIYEGGKKRYVKAVGLGGSQLLQVYKLPNESDKDILGWPELKTPGRFNGIGISEVVDYPNCEVETTRYYMEDALQNTLIMVFDKKQALIAYKNERTGIYQKMKYDEMGVMRVLYDVKGGGYFYFDGYDSEDPEVLSDNKIKEKVNLEPYYYNDRIVPEDGQGLRRLSQKLQGEKVQNKSRDSLDHRILINEGDTTHFVYRNKQLVVHAINDSVVSKFSYNAQGDLKLMVQQELASKSFKVRKYNNTLPPNRSHQRPNHYSYDQMVRFLENDTCQFPDYKFYLNPKIY